MRQYRGADKYGCKKRMDLAINYLFMGIDIPL